MQLRDYEFQAKAVSDIVAAARTLLASQAPGVILLDAPTGAGKTVTAAKAIAALSESYAAPLAFIWIAPNTLQEQSRARLNSIYGEDRSLSCVTPEELRGAEIEDRSILFLNWSSVNKTDNKLRRDGIGTETGRTLKELLDTTRAAGRKIVLIVDESHRDVNGEQAQVVVQHIIAPDLTLEISATPVLKSSSTSVVIRREDVVAAGVIRKQFVINPGLKETLTIDGSRVQIADPGSAEALLDVALAHRAKLVAAFAGAGAKVNPLVLVQLPEKGAAPADVRERIEDHLHRVHKVSAENGKVAIWLSEEKVNRDEVEALESPVEVLFFKQAIALGWDCPRAHILVSLREMKSPTFTAQVLGRVLRQPEHRHYEDPLLDSAYVFTNYGEFTLEKQFETVMATRLVTAKQDVVFPLPFWREANADQRLYLTDTAYRAIVEHARPLLASIADRGAVTGAMVSDLPITGIDWEGEQRWVTHKGDATYKLGEEQLEQMLSALVTEYVSKTAAQVDGRKHVRRALLEIAALVEPDATDKLLREIVLHPGNREAFNLAVGGALAQLLDEFEGKARSFTREDVWNPKGNKVLPWAKSLDGFNKCVYSPLLANEFARRDQPGRLNETELAFARMLDADPKVTCWLKNGDRGTEYFALPYELNGKARLFFPDFLAILSDGRYGIWDTKGHGEDGSAAFLKTTPKAEALARYRTERAAEQTMVVGGIVVRTLDGRWLLNDNMNYLWSPELKGWRPFAL